MELIKQIVYKFRSDPKALFLLDGTGALLSAFLLGVVLVRFENIFGMPTGALYFLVIFPCIFLIYDLRCYYLGKENWSTYIKVIAKANIAYCGISIGMVIYHFQELTPLGLAYFIAEIFIILLLVRVEFAIATNLSN